MPKSKVYVLTETWEQQKAALESDWVDGIYCGFSMLGLKGLNSKVKTAVEETKKAGKEFYLAMPYMLRAGQLNGFEKEFKACGDQVDGFLVRNLEELGYLLKLGLGSKIVSDYSLYNFNDMARNFWRTWES